MSDGRFDVPLVGVWAYRRRRISVTVFYYIRHIRQRATVMFPALKSNIVAGKLKEDYDVETALTLWLITSDTDCYRQGIGNFVPRDIRDLVVARTVCKNVWIWVHSNVNFSYWR